MTNPGDAMKKLLRSMLVYAPWVQDLRFAGEAQVLRALKRPFRPEFAGLRRLATEAPVVLDIGCNRGISISTILTMLPTADVTGFEANPDLAADTKRQFAGDPRVTILPFGLGSQAAEHVLHVPVYRGYRFDGLGSFDPWLASALFDGRLLYGFDPKRLVVEQKRVVVKRLDDYGLAPDVVKMYVQGHEPAVIEGAKQTIAQSEPIIIAASHSPEIDAPLRALGYRRYQWNRDRFEAEADFGYVVYYMTARRAQEMGA